MSDDKTPLILYRCTGCSAVYALPASSWEDECRGMVRTQGATLGSYGYRGCEGKLARIDIAQLLRLTLTSPDGDRLT